jgi:hypothetical protein
MSQLSRLLLTLSLFLYSAGCGLNPKAPDSASDPNPLFESISITSTALNGRIFHGGILVVSHATGTISVCWKTCEVIGKTEPSGSHDLVLTEGGNMRVYVENVATGRIAACDLEADEWMSGFKGGKCAEVGTATR